MSETKNTNIATLSSSMRFPKDDLLKCLEKISILFSKNAKNSMSTEAMNADLGFTNRSGESDSLFASLKYYNFLEKSENNCYKISDKIIDYCISGELTQDLVRDALMSVPVNKKIFARYDIEELPGDNQIKHFLIKDCNYSMKQATSYVETFKANYALYQSYNKKADSAIEQEQMSEDTEKVSYPAIVGKPPIDNSVVSYPLSNGKNVVIHLPGDIKTLDKHDLEDIKDILELVLKKVDKSLGRAE